MIAESPLGTTAQVNRPAPGRADKPRSAADCDIRCVSLALQGGGAFGAFTWGVLDRLLEEPALVIDAVSGASAGAVNAVLLAEGLRRGGAPAARAMLDTFWSRLAAQANRSFLPPSSRASLALDLSTRILSPYQLNPFDLNPLRSLLDETVDFVALRGDPPIRLLVSATRVSDGGLRLFREGEIDRDAVLASACLPLLNHAVEIDGDSYWDGGYSANPPLTQLVEVSRSARVLLVQIVPTTGDAHPTSSPKIVRRLQQITFNNPLQHELEALAAMKRLSEAGGETTLARKLADLSLDRISAEDWVPDLAERSLLDLGRSFLLELRAKGRDAAEAWLAGGSGRATEAALPEMLD